MKKLFYILLVFGCSCRNNEYAAINTNNSGPNTNFTLKDKVKPGFDSLRKSAAIIEDGDLVCRSGNDIISFSIANFSKQDKEYSHSGIAFKEDGKIFIYHVYAGKENPSSTVMRQPLDSFCNPKTEKGYGVFRYDMNADERNVFHELMKDNYKNKLEFDKLFDLKTTDKQYCAEMIAIALKKATNGRIIIPVSTIKDRHILDPSFKEVYVKQFDYLAVDNLFLNKFTRTIQRVKF